jgi:hypothetical protein
MRLLKCLYFIVCTVGLFSLKKPVIALLLPTQVLAGLDKFTISGNHIYAVSSHLYAINISDPAHL